MFIKSTKVQVWNELKYVLSKRCRINSSNVTHKLTKLSVQEHSVRSLLTAFPTSRSLLQMSVKKWCNLGTNHVVTALSVPSILLVKTSSLLQSLNGISICGIMGSDVPWVASYRGRLRLHDMESVSPRLIGNTSTRRFFSPALNHRRSIFF